MKKNLCSRIVVVIMAIVMLASSCLSISALSVSAPNTTTEDNDYYSVAYENGVLSIRVNPDKVYGMLKDGNISKEELLEFIPADVLETLAKGKEVTLDDLRKLAANYISVDDLKGLINNLPISVVREYFSFDMLLDMFTVSEIVDLVPVEEVLSAVDVDKFDTLLTDEVVKLALNENLKSKVLTDEFIQNVIDNTSLVDDLMADEAIKAQFIDLVDDEVVKAIMASEYGPKITEFAASKTVADRIIANTDAVNTLENYLTSDANNAAFNLFIKDKEVDKALVDIPEIKSYLLTEPVIHALVEKKVITQDNFRQIFTDNDIARLVTDDTLAALMANEEFVDDIFADNDIVTKVVTLDFALRMYNANLITVTSPDPDAIKAAVLASDAAKQMFAAEMRAKTTVSDYWKHIKPTDFETLAFGLETTIKNELTTNTEAYGRIFDVVAPDKIVEAIGMDNCRSLIHGHAADLITTLGISKVFEYYSQDGIVNALGGYSALVNNKFILVDEEIVPLCGGYANLLSFFDKEEIIDIVGVSKLATYVDMATIVDAAGGYSNLLKLYTNAELKAIITAIGSDKIKSLVTECAKDVLKSLDYRAIANDILDYAKSKVPDVKEFVGTVVNQTLTIFLTEVEGIYLNGETIYEAGAFDINKIIIQTLRAIPDINSFLELGENDVFAKYVLEADIAGEHYSYGIEFGFLGDPSNLQQLMQRFADNFQIDVSDNGDIDLQIAVPSVATSVYRRLLNSNRIPATLKEKLIMLPTFSIEDGRDVIAGISREEITLVVDVLKDELDNIKAEAYAEIDQRFGAYNPRARMSPTDVQRKIANAKAKADRLIDAFASVDTVVALQNKTLAFIDKIPATLSEAEILDFYTANGNFFSSVDGTVDFYEVINRYISLPEEIKLMFASTVLSYKLDTNFTVYNMYELELMLADGSTYKTLLPAGANLSVLNTVSALGDVSSGFCFGNTTNATVMPAADVKLYSNDLYSVQFVAGNEIVDTVFYVYGADSIKAPAIPEKFNKLGYNSVWADYELNVEKRLTVNLEYKVITYYATFVNKGETVAKLPFSIENMAITEPEAISDDPWYSAAWEAYELKLEDITVNAVYTKNTFELNFTANGNQVGETIYFDVDTKLEDLTLPAVPNDDAWYTGAWPTFALEPKNITVDAVYTKNTFELKFTANGNQVGETIYFDVDTKLADITPPSVPNDDAWYTGAWPTFVLEPKNVTVDAVYTKNTFYVTFKADGKQVGEPVPFNVDTKLADITAPNVPAKLGYNGAWEAYTLKADNITVNAAYTPITYTATFVADGKEVGKVQFTVETQSLTEPTVPAKVGYTGAWEAYTLEAKDITINAVYTPVVYTATFVADGKEVAKVQFTVEDKSIAEPAVPAKEGYTGKWEAYELKAEDITINAVYTPVSAGALEESGWLWWIVIILAVIIIVLVLILILRSRGKDDDNTPPPAVEPEPIVEPEPQPEPVVPVEIPEEVEDVTVEEVDELMTDDTALAAVVVAEAVAPSTGPKAIVNIGDINDNFSDGDTVNLDTLKEKKLVPAKTGRLKVLATGHLNKHNLTVEANSFSVQAIKMIQLTGGTVVQKK